MLTVEQLVPSPAVERAAHAMVVSICVNRIPPCGWPGNGQHTFSGGFNRETAPAVSGRKCLNTSGPVQRVRIESCNLFRSNVHTYRLYLKGSNLDL
jgi:hypothetical protein